MFPYTENTRNPNTTSKITIYNTTHQQTPKYISRNPNFSNKSKSFENFAKTNKMFILLYIQIP